MKPTSVLGSPAVTRRSALGALSALVGIGLLSDLASAQPLPVTPTSLVGTWSGQERGPIGVMSVQVIFFRNGTYRRSHQLRDLMTFDTGTYSVVQNWIHFQLENYGPRYYKGREMTRPMSDTWVVGQFDGRSLIATVGGNSQVSIRRQ